jgi:hypothetical protein
MATNHQPDTDKDRKALPWSIDYRHNHAGRPARFTIDQIEQRLRNDRPDLVDQLRDCPEPRRSTLDRIADALGSRMFLPVYLGFVAGCFFTVAMAWVWVRVGL